MHGISDHILAVVISYTVTMMLGIAARYRGHSFGRWHHLLFASTVISALWSLAISPSAAHAPVLAVLMLMPLTRPRTSRRHDALAFVGAISVIILVAAQ